MKWKSLKGNWYEANFDGALFTNSCPSQESYWCSWLDCVDGKFCTLSLLLEFTTGIIFYYTPIIIYYMSSCMRIIVWLYFFAIFIGGKEAIFYYILYGRYIICGIEGPWKFWMVTWLENSRNRVRALFVGLVGSHWLRTIQIAQILI